MITTFKLFEGSVKSSERIDIFRDNKYVIVAPLTAEASAKYGADTHWCTSALGNSYLWKEENIPNHPDSNRGLIILIRKGYKISDENASKSEEYYYLNREMDGGEIEEDSKERERWLDLQADINSYDMSKICITFSTNDNYRNNTQIWSANNQDMEISLYQLTQFDIDYYIIEEIEEYIDSVKNKKKELSISENKRNIILKPYSFYKLCIDVCHEENGLEVKNKMVGDSIKISQREFVKNCNYANELFKYESYMRDDPSTSFHKSKLRDQDCYYMQYCGFEYIFLKNYPVGKEYWLE